MRSNHEETDGSGWRTQTCLGAKGTQPQNEVLVEKPMSGRCPHLPDNAAHVDMCRAQAASCFVFREVQTHNELLELLRLRYTIYRNRRLKGFCPENKHGLDVDPYDARSRHFGLYSVNGDNAQELIGGIRVVEQSQTSAKRHLQLLASYYPIIRSALAKPIREQFPLLNYDSEEKEAVRRAIEGYKQAGEQIVEVGRLCVLSRFRALHIVKQIAESALSLGFLGRYGVDRALLTCNSTQRQFYTRYGFQRVPGTSDRYWEQLQAHGSVLSGTPNTVPARQLPYLMLLAEEFDRTGRIVYPANRQIQRAHSDRVAAVA